MEKMCIRKSQVLWHRKCWLSTQELWDTGKVPSFIQSSWERALELVWKHTASVRISTLLISFWTFKTYLNMVHFSVGWMEQQLHIEQTLETLGPTLTVVLLSVKNHTERQRQADVCEIKHLIFVICYRKNSTDGNELMRKQGKRGERRGERLEHCVRPGTPSLSQPLSNAFQTLGTETVWESSFTETFYWSPRLYLAYIWKIQWK